MMLSEPIRAKFTRQLGVPRGGEDFVHPLVAFASEKGLL